MSKYIKILGIAVFFILALFSSGFAEEKTQESLTITTYYPSPYGVYNELQLYPHSPPTSPCDDAHKGTMYYTGTGAEVYICDGTNWQPIRGHGVPSRYSECQVIGGTQENLDCPPGFDTIISTKGDGCAITTGHSPTVVIGFGYWEVDVYLAGSVNMERLFRNGQGRGYVVCQQGVRWPPPYYQDLPSTVALCCR